MKIQSSILFFMLKSKYEIESNIPETIHLTLSSIQLYQNEIKENTIYVIDSNQTIVPSTDIKTIFIFSNSEQAEKNKTLPSIQFKKSFSPIEILEILYSLIYEFYEWDAMLKNALLENISLKEYFKLFPKYIKRHRALIDKNYLIVAMSDNIGNYWITKYCEGQKLEKKEFEKSVKNLMLPSQMVSTLMNDMEYWEIEQKQDPFLFPFEGNDEAVFCLNFHSRQDYLARFLITMQKGEKFLSQGELSLLLHFIKYLEKVFEKYMGNGKIRNSNDKLHLLVRSLLAGDQAKMPINLEEILSVFEWKENHNFSFLILHFFEGSNWKAAVEYLCGEIERKWPQVCALALEGEIVCLINQSLYQENQPKTMLASISNIVREYACKAGISNDFFSFFDLSFHYQQAKIALEYGQIKDPHYWYYYFSDYTYPYLLGQLTHEFPASSLCHKGLKALVAYDKQNHTDYVKTLTTYLQCFGNASHAATKLFLHRTSFIRRMEKIKEITNTRLTDFEEILYLALSLIMIKES